MLKKTISRLLIVMCTFAMIGCGGNSEAGSEAKEEAAAIVAQARKEAELEKAKASDDVKKEMISVAPVMAEKIVASSLDEEKQSQLITDTLEEMGEETWLS